MRPPLRIAWRALAVTWALPNTLVGSLALALAAATGGRVSLVDGVLEAHGGGLRWLLARMPVGRGGAAALTLGHVVLGVSPAALAVTRAHERAHVAQFERWGPLFLPAYAAASLWALLRGASPYRDNWFEREAASVEDPGTEVRLPRPTGRTSPPSGPRSNAVRTARIIAIAADVAQLVFFPAFAGGWLSPLNNALDVVVAIVMVRLVGWHFAFLPTFVAELVPGVDLVPTWTAAVWFATRRRDSPPG